MYDNIKANQIHMGALTLRDSPKPMIDSCNLKALSKCKAYKNNP